jgi:hypothetical protein
MTFTLNVAANAAAEMPEVALMLPVGAGPDDRAPPVVSFTLGANHVTPAGSAGTKVTSTAFVPVIPPNW